MSLAATMEHMGVPLASEAPRTWTVGHLTFTEKPADRAAADCATCGIGMETGPTFGPIPQGIMLAEFVKQHTHKKGKKR